MNRPQTQNAPEAVGAALEGRNSNPTQLNEHEEKFVTSFPQSQPQSKAATLANGWCNLADLIPPHQAASAIDPIAEEFVAPAWCTTLAEQDTDEPQYPAQADPSQRVSISRQIAVPLALHRGRTDKLGGEHVVVPASAGVWLRQHHGDREPIVKVSRTEHIIGTDGRLVEDSIPVFRLRSGEARELGEVLIAAADLADAAAYEVALANARFIVGQADAEARAISLPETPEVGNHLRYAGGTR